MERIIGVCLILSTCLTTHCFSLKTRIRTKTGFIQGFNQTVLDREIVTFLGIPYAQPPVGSLRFREPIPVRRWKGTRESRSFSKACSQPAIFATNVPAEEQSEDCLYLNAWVPKGGCKRKAAMIWIYGGGLIAGDVRDYNGKFLAAYTDTIVFTLNYRTGPLGFLYLNDNEAPGNMGLLDQYLAIKWIYDNIKRFGGSRRKITLFGQSAGAASINYHTLSSFTRPYFQKAIIMSGAANSDYGYHSPTEALSTANEFANHLGCKKDTVDETIECLRLKPASALSALQLPSNPKAPLFFRVHYPTIDKNGFITQSPKELMNRPFPRRIPTLLGVVEDEEYLEPYLPNEPPLYLDVGDDIGSDIIFRCPVVEIAQTLSTVKPRNPVYMYSFEHRSARSPTPSWFGVIHGSETSYVFGYPLVDNVHFTDVDKGVSERMMKYWATFAKTGNPNFRGDSCGDDWDPYFRKDRKYLVIDSDCPQDGEKLLEPQCDFLEKVLD
ncbi:cholinesterase [Mytilus galloprovincialis]|uniref:Carboxylic ester hydrolase n=1 Tax=Mytilus galloprovincialis TaxID=29158 RepID=A0A8B6D2D7_MYTGA|nr:cholinesterase [Mytilus galloprovincialis]